MGATGAVGGDRFAFEVEWLDHNVGTKRKYQLMYYKADDTIEMVGLRTRTCIHTNIIIDDSWP